MNAQRYPQSVTRTCGYLYDPVHSAKGYFKSPALRNMCLFRTCANFPRVFSEQLVCPTHVLKGGAEPLCSRLERSHSSRLRGNLDTSLKWIEVNGRHRSLFFRKPIMSFLKPAVPMLRLQAKLQLDCDSLVEAMKETKECCSEMPDRTGTKQTQTDYRDSEAQTSPWTPPCRIRPDESPEVLTIAYLTWGHGLPAGMHEVEIINRMRMKRAWEAILPPMDSKANIKMRTTIIEAIEIDDWAFREAEIQFIMDMRMDLMDKYTKMKDEAREKKMEERYERIDETLAERRDKEVMNIRQRLGRELRKLAAKHRGDKDRWVRKCDEARGLGDSILKTHGRRITKSYHEIINRRILNKNNVPDLDEENRHIALPTFSQLKAVRPKQKASELCVRETRWNEEKLRRLHADLKAIRMDLKPEKKISLMKRRSKLPPMPVTPILFEAQNIDEKKEQAAVFIQKLVTGRAVQCAMFEGRDRCRELIEELQSTHWLQLETKKLRHRQKRYVLNLQRDQNRRTLQENRLSEILNMLEGMTLAGMLDYLSKELVRLKDERKAHAFALLAERERTKREAEEAGRRQLEEQRRREHDEMFRQMVKVDQESVELYLEDIIKEGIEWVSEAQVRQYIVETADQVDKASRYVDENIRDLLEEEMVSDMIYNFVLPDVEKKIMRKRMRQKQDSYLREAHAAIYNQILELPPIEQSRSTSESESTEESVEEEEEEAEAEAEAEAEIECSDQEIEKMNRETSIDWIKRRIIGEIISPGETLAGSILEQLIEHSVFSDREVITREILGDVINEVEALVGNL